MPKKIVAYYQTLNGLDEILIPNTPITNIHLASIHFGIDPVHLAIIFIANLELGFLTPPVGMNLFLSAYRFEEPMSKIYRATLPFFVIKLIAVGLITYFPFLTLSFFN